MPLMVTVAMVVSSAPSPWYIVPSVMHFGGASCRDLGQHVQSARGLEGFEVERGPSSCCVDTACCPSEFIKYSPFVSAANMASNHIPYQPMISSVSMTATLSTQTESKTIANYIAFDTERESASPLNIRKDIDCGDGPQIRPQQNKYLVV